MTVVLTDNTAGTVKKTGVEKSAPSSSKTAAKKKTTTKKKKEAE